VYSISAKGKFNWEVLKDYRKSYRESRDYQKYINNHSSHDQDLHDLLQKVQGFNFYKENNAKSQTNTRNSKIDNLVKKV